jgi:hypothetical protein
MDRKTNLFRLYPTPDQSAQMTQIAGACRFAYNIALEQRRNWHRPGRRFSFASQCREVTMLRAEVDWLKACLSIRCNRRSRVHLLSATGATKMSNATCII